MVAYKAVQIWSLLPAWYVNSSLLDLFESKFKNWHNDRPCNIF